MNGLLGSSVLEVVIGLSFLYFLLSLICSAINELIASLTRMRARYLKYGIENLLSDPELAKKVLNHPLITSGGTGGKGIGIGSIRSSLARRRGDDVALPLPSYVPSHIFTLALYDALLDGTSEPVTVEAIRRKALQFAQTSNNEPQNKVGTALLRLTDVARTPDLKQMLDVVDRVKQMLHRLPATTLGTNPVDIEAATTLEDVHEIVMNVPNPKLRQWLLNNMNMEEAKLQAMGQSIALWFDNAMDRVSGAYKRWTQLIVLVIAFLITALIGVDSIAIFNSLSTNPSLRTMVVAQAEKATKEGVPATADIKTQAAYQSLVDLSLPMGYSGAPSLNAPDVLSWWLSKIVGMLITIFAISLGAPFWFELLSKLVNLRGTGTPPKKPNGSTTPPQSKVSESVTPSQ